MTSSRVLAVVLSVLCISDPVCAASRKAGHAVTLLHRLINGAGGITFWHQRFGWCILAVSFSFGYACGAVP